jgi:hypothetical protein
MARTFVAAIVKQSQSVLGLRHAVLSGKLQARPGDRRVRQAGKRRKYERQRANEKIAGRRRRDSHNDDGGFNAQECSEGKQRLFESHA